MPAADREHRHEPRGGGGGRPDPGLAALARASTGTGRHVPARHGRACARARAASSSPRAMRTRTKERSASASRRRERSRWNDAVRGEIEFKNELLPDLVIVRSDGRPTYNFISPVDDITRRHHARDPRGGSRVEHADPDQHPARARRRSPVYAHVPNINGDDGRSSRSATAPSRSTTSATTATCPRR